jgi:hypothetical protein
MDRKLSAILSADVVGYSALMERDEAGTFERLRAGHKERGLSYACRRPKLFTGAVGPLVAQGRTIADLNLLDPMF